MIVTKTETVFVAKPKKPTDVVVTKQDNIINVKPKNRE